MKKTALIIPTEKEASLLGEHPNVSLHIGGVGIAECAATTARVIATEQPDLIILAGIAGSYTTQIAVGETVAVESEVVADMGRLSGGEFVGLFQKTYNATQVPNGYRAVKSNTVNCAGAIIAQPIEAEIENMEGAGFLAVCEQFGLSAMEIRTISNCVGEPINGENLQISITRLAEDLNKIIVSL